MKQPKPIKISKITLGIFIFLLTIVSILSIAKIQTLPATPRIEQSISMTLACLVLLAIHVVPLVALFLKKSWARNYCIALFGLWAIFLFLSALLQPVASMASGIVISLLLLWLAISLIRSSSTIDYLKAKNRFSSP